MSEPAPARRAACFGRDLKRDGWPSVSVVVPVRDEGADLERAVHSILDQQYPEPFDVCLAVAPSDDDTADVAARLEATNDHVRVVENPAGITPAGLNAAIRSTHGSIIVRVDGHSELSPGYIRRSVETMCRTGAVNVGGLQVPRPQTPFEEAVAAATTSWFGTGGATYRVGGEEGPVDTVYLGVFDRATGAAVGWFDETLIRNQDYELNVRLRAAGGSVWFDPDLSVGYRPRRTMRALAKQYYEYGWWKAEVLQRDPSAIRLRQIVAPAGIIGVVLGAVLGRWWRPARLAPLLYGAALATSAARGNWRTPCALATIHGAWCAGMFARIARGIRSPAVDRRAPFVRSSPSEPASC